MNPMRGNTPEALFALIESSKSICISGHTAPDGDALGSTCGLTLALRKLGKTVTLLAEDFNEKYLEIPGADTAQKIAPACDLFLALDCAALDRLGIALPYFQAAAHTVNIDHHGSNTRYGELNYVDGDASSTSELIYELLTAWGIPLDKDIATALYTGILHDTGGFRHSCTHPSTMEATGKLLSYGIPFSEIQDRQLYSHTFPEMKMAGLALYRAELDCGGQLIYTHIGLDEVEALHGDIKGLDQIVGMLKSVNDTRISAFFYEKAPGTIKASFRADGSVDVSKIAQQFGGGGHVRAAGCTLNGTMEDAKAAVLPVLKAALEA